MIKQTGGTTLGTILYGRDGCVADSGLSRSGKFGTCCSAVASETKRGVARNKSLMPHENSTRARHVSVALVGDAGACRQGWAVNCRGTRTDGL